MHKIVGIITLYYPKSEQVDNAKRIAEQVDLLLLCDNSKNENCDMFQEIKNAKYFFWGENRGLSRAFNTVLKDAALDWKGSDYVIFFDQDSVIPDQHIQKLIAEYEQLICSGVDVGCLGPVYYNTSNQRTEVPKDKEAVSEKSLKVKSIITTSMLCTYKNLKGIGFWNENIFLDMADWDICWRFMAQGKLCCMTFASVIRHSVGQGKKKVGPIELRVGSPFREYYQTRDCQYLLKEDYVPFKFKMRFYAMLTLRPALHLLFLENKKERMQYIRKGMRDYKQGITGSL